MKKIKDFMSSKLAFYRALRMIGLTIFVISGGLAIVLQFPLLRFLFASITYIIFFSLTIIIDKRYTLYKTTIALIDTGNTYFINYLLILQEEESLEDYDIPLFGLHSAIHPKEMKYRSQISLAIVGIFGIAGLLLAIFFNSFAFFMLCVGPGGCLAMYIDAAIFVGSLRKNYAEFYCNEIEKRSIEKNDNPKEFTLEERKLAAKDMALIYSWKNCETKHNGMTSIYDWDETKMRGHLPRIPAVLREVMVSAHKREFESNLTYALSISFAGWILLVLFPFLADILPGFERFLGLGTLSDTIFLNVIAILAVTIPALYYIFNMTSVLGKRLNIPGIIARRTSLYERFQILKYIAYFYPLKENENNPSLPDLISSLEQQGIIIMIDFARSVYDYALGCSLGIYSDHKMYFEKPILISEIKDDYSKLVYPDQAVTQKQKGTVDILLGTLTAICITWILQAPLAAGIVFLSGIFLLILWEIIIYRWVLPIPSIKKMKAKIQKLKDAGIID